MPTALQPRITTSWDDGHPHDLRLADLLEAHGIAATFYIPRANTLDNLPVMDEAQIRGLAERGFEIGAHTLNHIILTQHPDAHVQQELAESKAWVEQLSGRPCTMFCPPNGKFSSRHVSMFRDAGFAAYRTTELWSIDPPRMLHDGLLELPTTLQAQPQPTRGTVRNLVRRRALTNAGHFLKHGRGGDWTTHAEAMLDYVLAQNSGVFHLWGHSWELEAEAQWDHLDRVLGLLKAAADRAAICTNSQVCAG